MTIIMPHGHNHLAYTERRTNIVIIVITIMIKPVTNQSNEKNDDNSGSSNTGCEGDEGGGEDLVDDRRPLLHDVQLNLVVDLRQVLCGQRILAGKV